MVDLGGRSNVVVAQLSLDRHTDRQIHANVRTAVLMCVPTARSLAPSLDSPAASAPTLGALVRQDGPTERG